MKKVLSLALVLAITTTSFAQKHSKDLRIGFKLEPNIAWLNPNENGVKNDGSKVGINYGLMVDYEFADNYIFSTGFQISQLGGKLSYTGTKTGTITATTPSSLNTANYNLSIRYLELPFAIKLKSDNKGKMDFWGSFGGFLAIPVKGRADVQTNFLVGAATTNYSSDNEDMLSNIQPVSLGMQVGAGVEIPLSNKNVLVAGLLFNNGFIDVTKNGKWNDDGRINMNNLALKLGIFF